MGRVTETYKGYKILTHTGSVDGFYSNMTLIPSAKIGVFIIHNGEAGGAVRTIMAFPVIDRLLGLTNTPWSQRYLADYKKSVAQEKHDRRRALQRRRGNERTAHGVGQREGRHRGAQRQHA